MKKILSGLLLALTLAFAPNVAQAQSCQGVFQAGEVCGAATTGPAKNAFSTGVSGHKIPFLDGNNAWSGTNTFLAPVGANDAATKAYVDSHSVTPPSGAANTPLFNDGAGGFTNGTRSGNTTSVATTSGSLINGHCVAIDASGNFVDYGAGCSAGAGTVTTLSVVSANGLAGTVANPTTTPAITLSTSVTGLLKGNGTAISAAAAGTDYAAAPSGTANTPLFNNGSGGFTNGTVSGNTTKVVTTTGTLTNTHCVSIDANGNFVDAGGACTTGGGGGTVSSGLINQLGWYAASGTTISGLPTGNNSTLVTDGSGVPSIASTLPLAVQSNITQLGSPITSAQTWNSHQYFKSGRPWVDIRAYGATGNGSADDTSAINSAVAAASSIGGEVYFPPGNYCIKTAGGITVSSTGLVLRGPSWDSGVIVQTCGTNSKLFTLNADSVVLKNMSLLGAGYGASSGNNTITLGPSCVRCLVRDVTLAWGYYAIDIQAPDTTLDHVRISGSYGPAVVHASGLGNGAYIMHAEIDQNWPVSTPTGISSFSARANSHAYSTGDTVSVSGYYIQASSNCTSGGSTPTLASYGTAISDGTCSWYLVAPTAYYGIQLDTGAINNFIQWTDLTGPYTYGIYISNTGAGTAPDNIDVNNVTFGAMTSAGIYASAGTNLFVRGGSQIGTCVTTSCVGVWIGTAWNANAVINGIQTHQLGASSNGVLVQGGKDTVISNSSLFAGSAGTGISVQAGVSDVTITGNSAGSSPQWGTNSACIYIFAGAGDYINVDNNDCSGATGASYTVNGLTGTHNKICLNATTCLGTNTNNNADAGNIGEYFESQVAATAPVAITSGVNTDITYLDLTAGDWEVCGNAGIIPAATTTTSAISAWIAQNSATSPTIPGKGAYYVQTQSFPAGQYQLAAVGCRRFTYSTTTRTYLTINATFAVSTNSAMGTIWARRMR